MSEPAADDPAKSARRIPTLSRTGHDRAGLRRRDAQWLERHWPTAKVLRISGAGTAPSVTGPSVTGSSVTGSSVTGSSVTGSSVTGSSVTGPGTTALALLDGAQADPQAPRTFLGEVDDRAYFAVPAEPDPARAESWQGLRELGGVLDDLDAGLFTAAVALSNWHATHQHCPRCGARTERIEAGWSRRCPVDGSQHFPRTDPAVIMLVHDGDDRCVLGRQASWGNARFSILAGFVEAGESAEAAVVREVYEEVGLRVTDVTYQASQPWPFPASLMLGFTARAVGDLTIRRYDDELADAGWFTRAEIRSVATAEAAGWTSAASASPAADAGASSAGAPDLATTRTGPRLGALPGGISIARHLLEDWLSS